jgi:hypothetical protein
MLVPELVHERVCRRVFVELVGVRFCSLSSVNCQLTVSYPARFWIKVLTAAGDKS